MPSVDGMAKYLFHCIVDPYNLDPDLGLDSCKHHLLVVEYPFHILHCDMILKGVSRVSWANRAKWVSREDLVPESSLVEESESIPHSPHPRHQRASHDTGHVTCSPRNHVGRLNLIPFFCFWELEHRILHRRRHPWHSSSQGLVAGCTRYLAPDVTSSGWDNHVFPVIYSSSNQDYKKVL